MIMFVCTYCGATTTRLGQAITHDQQDGHPVIIKDFGDS